MKKDATLLDSINSLHLMRWRTLEVAKFIFIITSVENKPYCYLTPFNRLGLR